MEGILLTGDQLHAMALEGRLNPEVAKEALVQTEKRLADVLDVRKSTEQKAQALFTAYVTLSIALFGIGGALVREVATRPIGWPFLAAGMFLLLGGGVLVFTQKGAEYGYLGTAPVVWLQAGTIDGGEQALPLVLASTVLDHEKRINGSLVSNRRKRVMMYAGMVCGLVAATTLATGLIFVWGRCS